MAGGARLRLLLDEMYPPGLADALRARGHDADAVASRSELLGRTDAALLAAATGERRALVTENVGDFVDLARILGERRQRHAGIILVNARRFPRSADRRGPLIVAIDVLGRAWPNGLADQVVWLQPTGEAPQ